MGSEHKPIRAEVHGVVTMTNGEVKDTPVMAEFEYDECYPLEYTIIFTWNNGRYEREVVWTIGRDSFTEALREGSSGGGDTVVVDCGKDMALCLLSPEGSCTILLDMGQLVPFINETLKLVPQGEEDIESAVDDFLAEVFE